MTIEHQTLYNRTNIETTIICSWYSVALLFTLSGNTFVLYATIRHKAIKLDKMSIWIIQNLAVVDLANAVINIIPVMVNSAMGNRWVFGWLLCYINSFIQQSPLAANALLINILQFNKIYRCVFPLSALSVTKVHKITSTLLVVFMTFIVFVAAHGAHLYWRNTGHFYKEYISVCVRDKSTGQEGLHVSWIVIDIVVWLVPCVGLVISTLILIYIAVSRAHRHVNKAGILCYVLMTTVFTVSFMPIYMCFMGIIPKNIVFLCLCILSLQSCLNPALYYLSNRTFREFTNNAVKTCCDIVKNKISARIAFDR